MWEMWDMRKRDGLDLLTQVVLVLLGVYFICLKQQALVHITTLLGLLMTAGGAACIVRAFIRKEQSSLFLSMPVLLAVGGIVLLIFRKQATEVVPFCIGVWALVLGVVKTVVAVQYAAARVRNWWVQIIPAALGILMGILILTGTVTLIAYNIDLSIVDLQQSNEIVVWIDDNLTTREAKDLQPQFEKIENTATVEFEDRDVALEKYRKELGDDAGILDDYNSSNNPLRNSYILTLKDSTKAEETIADIGMIEGVASVRADEAVIGKLIQIQHVFNIIALAMVAGLAVISIFIISNTVKLAMFARREEISIQKIVGATNWFIRWPFVIEGMIIGLIAGGLAFLAEWALYTELFNVAGGVIPYFEILPFDSLKWLVLAVFAGAGALFGIGGSVTSIRKFMDV